MEGAKKNQKRVQNLYQKQNLKICEQENKIMQLEEKIIQLNEFINFLKIENEKLIQENCYLHQLVLQLKNQNEVFNSSCNQLEQKNQILIQSFYEIQSEKKGIEFLLENHIQLKMLNKELEEKNRILLINLNDLEIKIEKLKSENKDLITLKSTFNKFFDTIYKNSIQNTERKKNYYPPEIKDIFIIISFVGKSWYLVLQQIFNLPCYRTVQRYRIKYIKKFGLSIELFDGQIENLKKLKEIFTKNQDMRYVISIDAISLKSYVSITKDGIVKGLKFIKEIPKDFAIKCLENENQFNSFLVATKHQIENYIFVIYLCALNPNMKSFPVVLISDVKGNCTDNILNIYKQTKQNLLALNFDIIGNSFDGDLKYFEFLNEKYNQIINIQCYDLNLPFDANIFYEKNNLMFSDPLHLLKCARYRYVNNTPKFCFFADLKPSIDAKSFLEIGVPHYLLDPSQSKKMEDNLPKELFCFKYLYYSRSNNRMDLYFALFPFVMLQEAIFNENLTNDNRYECLEKGLCFVIIYSICLEHYFEQKEKFKDKNLFFIKKMNKSKNCIGITSMSK